MGQRQAGVGRRVRGLHPGDRLLGQPFRHDQHAAERRRDIARGTALRQRRPRTHGRGDPDAAARHPDRVRAAASFYGTWLVNDAEESPHLNLGGMTGEIYISCAEHDDLAPPDMVAELRRLFDASGVRGEMEIQPGVHHGFAFPDRWCYDKPAAERHWERLIALYRRSLH